MGWRIASGAAAVSTCKIEQAAGVMRLQPVRRIAHDLKVEIMHARLVQDDVRKLREPVFDILHPAVTNDLVLGRFVRFPECRLVDPIRLLQHTLAEAESLEHLHGPAGNAVGLAEQQRAGLLIDDPGFDVRKGRELCGQCQSRRSAADDQDIDFIGKAVGVGRRLVLFGRFRDLRIAGSESVEMELHRATSSAPRSDWRSTGATILPGSCRAASAQNGDAAKA